MLSYTNTVLHGFVKPLINIDNRFYLFSVTEYRTATLLEPPLKGIQILFIICAIMFLTLLLLGLGVSYYCLRRRPIIVRRLPVSIGTGSEITKLSGSSLGTIINYETLHFFNV